MTPQISWTLSLAEQGYVSAGDERGIVAIQHLPDQQAVCIATKQGDALLYNTMSLEVNKPGPNFMALLTVSQQLALTG